MDVKFTACDQPRAPAAVTPLDKCVQNTDKQYHVDTHEDDNIIHKRQRRRR